MFHALQLQRVKDDRGNYIKMYRAIVFEIDDEGYASIAEIVESDGLFDAAYTVMKPFDITHVWVSRAAPGFVRPMEGISVYEAAKAILFAHLLTEEIIDPHTRTGT